MLNEKILYQMDRAERLGDRDASRDLTICIVNTQYVSEVLNSTVRNLQKKFIKNTFDRVQAVQAFFNCVNCALSDKCFYRDYSYNKNNTSVPTRYAVAVELLDYYTEDIESKEEY